MLTVTHIVCSVSLLNLHRWLSSPVYDERRETLWNINTIHANCYTVQAKQYKLVGLHNIKS